MTTREKILDAALTLFAEKGYGDVYVGDIARAVGIRAPSLYKHFKSKRDIFDAILEEMDARYARQSAAMHMNGSNAGADAAAFSEISEDSLVEMGIGLFQYFLHDDYTARVRKMLTIGQFQDPDLAGLYDRLYLDGPLSYQGGVFGLLLAGGKFRQADAGTMALHFYSPIYLMLTLCDRQPQREPDALEMIKGHIRQFNRIYKREEII